MYIKARVIAGSKKEELIIEKPDHFKVFLREKAERNMANDRLRELLAIHFKVEKSAVWIINGHHSPQKLLSVKLVGES